MRPICYNNAICLFDLTEIPLPNEQARLDIIKIHAAPIAKHGDIGEYFVVDVLIHCIVSLFGSDWEAVVKLSDGFNGADLRNVCTEAGKLINLACFVIDGTMSIGAIHALNVERFEGR